MINTLEELQLALSDQKEFKRLIENGEDFIEAIEKFPEYQETLIGVVYKDPEEFKRLVPDGKTMGIALKKIPGTEKLLLTKLEDPEEFKRLLLSSTTDFIGCIKPLSKETQTFLIEKVLNDSKLCETVIDDYSSFTDLAVGLPDHADKFIEKILFNTKDFQRIVYNLLYLDYILGKLPSYKNVFIEHIINDPEEFKRVVKTDENLKFICKNSTMCKELFKNCKTNEEAQKIIAERSDYAKNAAVGALRHGEYSRHIPDDAKAHIGTFFNVKTAVHTAAVNKEANVLAKESLNKDDEHKTKPSGTI